MTHSKRSISILIAIATLILSLALPVAAGAQTETTLYVNPATSSATTCPSSAITVAIRVGNVVNLTAFHLEIYFDPAVIQVNSIVPAAFIIGPGETYLPEPSNEIDNVNGFISWGLAKQGTGGDPNPVSGTGDLILITLHAIVPNDSSPIDIDAANSILVNWPDAFEIPFTATDGVVNTSSCPPTDIALSNNTIQENMPIGTTIGTFSSTDPDGDTTFTYTLVNPTGYPDNGSFTITGSTLKSAVSFNYEFKNSYHIRVRSTDPWGAYYEEVFSILIIDVNDAPVLAPIGDQIAAAGTLLTFTVTATDQDSGQTLTYSLTGAPLGASIDPATGVFTWTPTVAQAPGVYTFDVCVSDGVFTDCETITVTVYVALQVTALDLWNATDPAGPWTAVPGSYQDGFVMQLDPDVEWYYLDTNTITSNRPLADGLYPFTISRYPTGFFEYWAGLGVVDGATGWQGVMWQIINGDLPFFYLKVVGTQYTLLDGLQYAMGNTTALLRVDGTYLLGAYTFSGEVEDDMGFSDALDVDISFVGLLQLTDAQLQYSLNQTEWTNLSGSFSAGYSMLLDTTVKYYYLNAPSVTVNRPLALGLHPFYIESYPSGFFAYWAGRGVVEGATGWQGVMWQIINGNSPIFYLKVSAGPTYQLVDGLSYQYGGVETYLRIDGTYLPGPYSFSGTVTDEYGYTDEVPVSILFNDIPVAEDQSVSTPEDTALGITLTAVDLYPGTLTWTVDTQPQHGTLSGTAPALTYTPNANYNGPDEFTFKVNDGTSDSNVATITITVTAVNDAPVLGSIGNKSVNELELLTFTASATDIDEPAQTLTFSLTGAPAGALIDPSTGEFTWTPSEAQGPGTYTFSIKVCDDGTPILCDEKQIEVTVYEVNVPPVAVNDTYGAVKNQVLTILAPGVMSNDTDADLPANTLTAELVADIPAGEGILVFATSGAFSYTPPTDFLGNTSFTYKVFDGSDYSNIATVTITVSEGNLPPTDITMTDQTILENQPIGTVVSYLSSVDPNLGDTFTYTLVDLEHHPDNAFFRIDGNRLLSAEIFDYETKDSYTIRIRTTDQGGLWFEKNFVITILDVNDAPVADDQTLETLEDTPLSITLTGYDQDGDTLTFAVIAQPMHGILTGIAPILTYTPAANYNGPDSFTFNAADGQLVSNVATVSITVIPVNDAPILSPIGNKSVNELVLLTFTASATDIDLPAQTLTFSLTDAPTGAAIDPSTGVFTWTPTEAQGPGTYTFDVCVSDGVATVCETITVTVNEVNVAPVLGAIGSKTVNELALLTFTATATDSDIPVQTLTFSLANGEAGQVPVGASIVPSTGVFTWTPTEVQGPGTYTFDVCVSDGVATVCETITVTVNEVNIAPVLLPIGNKTTDELVVLTFTATATDADLPANTLTFSLQDGTAGGVPYGAAIDPSTGVFSWTPTEAQGPGTYTFDVCVSDGVATVCETITVTVNEVNVAPVLGAIGSKTVNELALLTFTATATDSDIPVQTLTFSLEDGTAGHVPTGASIDPSTGAFTWTPTEVQGPGTYTFDVCVSDGALSDCETITVTVNEVNLPPVLNPIGNQEVDELDTLTFTATASDSDIPAQTLTFSLEDGTTGEVPDGATIDPDTGEFTWTPTEAQGPGEYTFDVCVSDGVATVCETITVTVNEINIPPVAQDMTVTTAEDTSLDIPLDVYDADGNPLTVIIVTQPLHGSLVINGLTVTYTPYLNYNGPDSFVYKVNDGLADSNTATVSITVTPVNDPPVAYGATVETMENTAVDFELLATDPDGDFGTYHIVTEPEHGTLECDGRYCTYTPDSHWFGTDSLVFKVNDGELDSNEATVVLIVHPLPRIYLPLISK
ncbi:MAG TPA: Ig-like domain-containing protein [Anaerolineaceae bacterium]|nr:Ig-like domain-containing protein [Anaerolineaceae bacterium]